MCRNNKKKINTGDIQKPAFLCVFNIKVVSAFGRSYDDYDYGEVNQLLERDLKLYVKAVACFPDSTKTPVCPLRWTPLKTSERVRLFFVLRRKLSCLQTTYDARRESRNI